MGFFTFLLSPTPIFSHYSLSCLRGPHFIPKVERSLRIAVDSPSSQILWFSRVLLFLCLKHVVCIKRRFHIHGLWADVLFGLYIVLKTKCLTTIQISNLSLKTGLGPSRGSSHPELCCSLLSPGAGACSSAQSSPLPVVLHFWGRVLSPGGTCDTRQRLLCFPNRSPSFFFSFCPST